ncbi:MAG: hypothetical protein KAR11_02255 [Phycisphaerae bacterium]|nr:hypothetical protein [Phycisphaerae bacterium]
MKELSVDSLLSVAIAIETNGAEYYRQAAEFTPPEISEEFLRLAAAEDSHTKTFEFMQKALTSGEEEPVKLNLSEAQTLYLERIISGAAFITPGGVPRLKGDETLGVLLKKAIDDEKDTIVFYQCLRSAVKQKKLLEVLGLILDEELTHVFDLTHRLEKLETQD